MRVLGFILLFFTLSISAKAQFGEFIGLSASLNTHIIDMNVERAATKTLPKLFLGGGVAYSMSIKEGLNFRIGADFLKYKPINSRGYYDVCENEGEDYSCLPQIMVAQIYLPLATEFYMNTNYKPYHTFFVFSLVPSFSIFEKKEMLIFNKFLEQVDQKDEQSIGPKFQDITARIGVGNEFSLPGNLKFFVEPSAGLSLLLRKQNFVNPLTSFVIKIGLRYRTEKKK